MSQPSRIEGDDRLTHRDAADAEALGDLVLAHAVALAQLAVEDERADVHRDEVTAAPAVHRAGSGANPARPDPATPHVYVIRIPARRLACEATVALDVPHVLELAPPDGRGTVAALVLPAHEADHVHHRRQVLEAHVVPHLTDRFEHCAPATSSARTTTRRGHTPSRSSTRLPERSGNCSPSRQR